MSTADTSPGTRPDTAPATHPPPRHHSILVQLLSLWRSLNLSEFDSGVLSACCVQSLE